MEMTTIIINVVRIVIGPLFFPYKRSSGLTRGPRQKRHAGGGERVAK